MEITEVRIKLIPANPNLQETLHAYCSVTFDDLFVVRDLKIISGPKGYFLAMPSRKLTDYCPFCSSKNHLRARFCSQCGRQLNENRAPRAANGRAKLHADIAHPINGDCRKLLHQKVMAAYFEELRRAQAPDYVSRYDQYEEPEYDTSIRS